MKRSYPLYILCFWISFLCFSTLLVHARQNTTEIIKERERQYEEAVIAKNGPAGLFNGNTKKAIKILTTLIAQNSNDYVAKNAAFALGEWYLLGIPRINIFKWAYDNDIDKSVFYLSIAANLGHPRSNYLLSFIYHILSLYEVQSSSSNQTKNESEDSFLGKFFTIFNKKTTKNDYSDSKRLISKHLQIACQMEDVMALSTLGYILLYNKHEGDNYMSSLNCYKKAISLIITGKDGNLSPYTLEAQLPVAILNDDTIRVLSLYESNFDKESSMDYWHHKASKGDPLAQYELSKLQDDDNQAEELLAMAADKSHAPALRDLAIVYLSRGNVQKAVELLMRAADLGDAESATILSYILLRDEAGIKKLNSRDPTVMIGLKYLLMACKQNVPDALFLMAEIMSHNGHFKDFIWLYDRAADAGFIQAIWIIAHYHQSLGDYLKSCFDYKLIADSSPSISKYINLGFKYFLGSNFVGSLICFLIASYHGSLLGQFNSAYLCQLMKSKRIRADKIDLDVMELFQLSQALVQGSNNALHPIAKLVEKSDPIKAFSIYKRSFFYGDSRSILPLVKYLYSNGDIEKSIELLQFHNHILDLKKISFIGDIIKDGKNLFKHYYNKYKISLFLKVLNIYKKLTSMRK